MISITLARVWNGWQHVQRTGASLWHIEHDNLVYLGTVYTLQKHIIMEQCVQVAPS